MSSIGVDSQRCYFIMQDGLWWASGPNRLGPRLTLVPIGMITRGLGLGKVSGRIGE